MNILLTIIQLVAITLLAPLAAGLVKKFKALLQGRKGASVFLPYLSLRTLLRKEMVIAESVSFVFHFVPFASLFAAIFPVLYLPLIFAQGYFAAWSNFIIFAATLAFGAIFLVWGGLDSASAFGGMGASREITIASLLEPIIILVFCSFAIATGQTDLTSMINQVNILEHPFLILSLLSFCMVLLAENARYPVDNPATHLELTMVHEGMLLEYPGPYLAILEYAAMLKLTFFSLLLAHLVWPIHFLQFGIFSLISFLLVAVCKLIMVTFLLAFFESITVKMRFYRLNEFFTTAFFLSLGGLIITLLAKIISLPL